MITKNLELKGHSGAIYAIDGVDDSLYSGSGDNFVARWNLTLGTQDAFSIKADKSIYSLKLVQDDKILVFGTSSGSLHVVNLEEKRELKHFIQHKSAIFAIVENFHKNHLYTTDADGNLAIWNTLNWNLLIFLPLQVGKIRDIHVSNDGKIIFVACQDENIRIFETSNYNEIQSFHAHKDGVNCLHLFPLKPQLLLSGGKDGHLRIWNWKEEKCLYEIPAHNFGIYRIIFLQQGRVFVTASRDKTIKIWDAFSADVLKRIERKDGGHSHAVNDLWKKDEMNFVSTGDDKRIIWWEMNEVY
jgi:WD40 repeat protein